MENINLNNYSLLATGTQVPLYRIDDTHVNGYYPHLLTENQTLEWVGQLQARKTLCK